MIYRLATLDLPLHTPNHSWNGLPPHTPTSKGGGTLYIVANTQGTQTYLLPQWKTLIERISPHNTGTRRIPVFDPTALRALETRIRDVSKCGTRFFGFG